MLIRTATIEDLQQIAEPDIQGDLFVIRNCCGGSAWHQPQPCGDAGAKRDRQTKTLAAVFARNAKEHATIGALVDPPATCINASGDTVASMIVARFVEGKDWFQKKQAERAEKAGA